MKSDWKPTEKYPALADERLSILANALRDVRDHALTLYDPLGGDDNWSHGCRVYSRSKFRVKQLSQTHTWLSVVEEEPKPIFTFAIAGIPIRFYKGSPDDPPANYIVITYGELMQRQLFKDLRALDRILRIAVETDREGRVSSVALVELDEAGEATGVHIIPFDVAPSNVLPLETKPIDLKPPTVEPIESEEHQRREKKSEKGKRKAI